MPSDTMGHWYKFVLLYLWIAPHILLAAVSVLMFVRRQDIAFPLFFVYTIFETLEFLLLFGIQIVAPDQGTLYLYAFVATLTGSIALRFGVIQEIFNNVFHDYRRLEAVAVASMRWVAGLLLLAAILLIVHSSGTAPEKLMAGVRLLDRSVAIIQAGLLLFLFSFSQIFGLSWRSCAFGIALGFGILASTDLARWALELTDLPEPLAKLLNLLPTGSYHVSVLVWLGYLLAGEKPVAAAACAVTEMDEWSGQLERPRQ